MLDAPFVLRLFPQNPSPTTTAPTGTIRNRANGDPESSSTPCSWGFTFEPIPSRAPQALLNTEDPATNPDNPKNRRRVTPDPDRINPPQPHILNPYCQTRQKAKGPLERTLRRAQE
jgi:hypothetical protein